MCFKGHPGRNTNRYEICMSKRYLQCHGQESCSNHYEIFIARNGRVDTVSICFKKLTGKFSIVGVFPDS